MTDRQREAVYRAETEALGAAGPRFRRWVDLEAWVGAVVTDDRWLDGFPGAPVEVAVLRRSRGATASVAEVDRAVIHIRDGSWDAPTVVHELAHLASVGPPDHGPRFAATELALVRSFLGFPAYGALRTAFVRHGVDAGGAA